MPMPPAVILLVDDEKAIQRAMVPLLRSRGYEVTTAGTGAEALAVVASDPPSLVVLDLGLPDLDGLTVCQRIRERSDVPIVVLSARGAERDKIAALDQGADDYVTKPFSPEEFLARVRAALRRTLGREDAATGELRAGPIRIDLARRRVTLGDRELHLTPKEYELLCLLASRAGQVLTHRTILRAIWGPHSVGQPEHLRVLVAQVRRKIEDDPSRPKRLLTEPWVGYRLADAADPGTSS
jgi:two-component system, OmpR family, KDP operon response regulator KdpE